MAEIIEEEVKNEDAWDQLDGCRRGKHARLEDDSESQNKLERTGGIQAWKTQSNFIIYLEEVDHYETPTEVLLSLLSLLKLNKQYSDRIMAIGYDMACTLLGRAQTLIKKKILTEYEISLLIKILHILFIDKWHVKGHKKPICNQGKNGLLNPYLDKFKGILWGRGVRTNDQVVEQGWKTINKLRFAKNMTQRKFRFTLLEYRQRHNKRTKNNLIQQGYTFVDITRLSAIRDIKELETSMPTMQMLLNDDKYQKLQKPHFID